MRRRSATELSLPAAGFSIFGVSSSHDSALASRQQVIKIVRAALAANISNFHLTDRPHDQEKVLDNIK